MRSDELPQEKTLMESEDYWDKLSIFAGTYGRTKLIILQIFQKKSWHTVKKHTGYYSRMESFPLITDFPSEKKGFCGAEQRFSSHCSGFEVLDILRI